MNPYHRHDVVGDCQMYGGYGPGSVCVRERETGSERAMNLMTILKGQEAELSGKRILAEHAF